MERKLNREKWIDLAKIVACILVALGHLLQSLEKANIINNSDGLEWFMDTIYLFHVQIFFICSGYLYERNSIVNTLRRWKENIIRKLIYLGIPYFFFSSITIVLKNLFRENINNSTQYGIKDILFSPIPPYWFLYVLFFIFVFIPTVKTYLGIGGLLLFIIILRIVIVHFGIGGNIYFLAQLATYGVWFVIGMLLALTGTRVLNSYLRGLFSFGIFIVVSIIPLGLNNNGFFYIFLMGLLATYGVLSVCFHVCSNNKLWWIKYLSRYTMPVYLMHTLCAAPIRVVLNKLGAPMVLHFFFGIFFSFVAPCVVYEIMIKMKISFLVSPDINSLGRKYGK